jgi:hypothetical protein
VAFNSTHNKKHLIGFLLMQAKILRMSHDPEGAIRVLEDGLKADRPHVFREADTLVSLLQSDLFINFLTG